MRAMLIAGVMLAASGCASVQMGDPVRNTELKKFESKPDIGQIYVCRGGNMMGVGIRPDIILDGKPMATIARSTYAYQEVKPGTHTLVAKTLEHDSRMSFTIAAGEQKFFQTWISMGVLSGWGIIDEIDRGKGKECVAGGDLVEAVRQ